MKWIKKIIAVDGFNVECLWNDGNIRTIYFENYIRGKSNSSSYARLKNFDIFSKVQCDGTTLYWENLIKYQDLDGTIKEGNLDIAPETLFELTDSAFKNVI